VTRILHQAGQGSKTAVDQLLSLLHDELRRLAQDQLEHEPPGHTLQATALVHEVYLKLVHQDSLGFADRAQFFGAAATVMRRILVDHARGKKRQKRRAEGECVPLDDVVACLEERADDLVALDEALARLGDLDPQKARIVELRFFGGLTVAEACDVLNLPRRTVEREWTLAKAWLRGEVSRNDHGNA
jgi:RNA polymerase sigma factor (TIGR02999 family)